MFTSGFATVDFRKGSRVGAGTQHNDFRFKAVRIILFPFRAGGSLICKTVEEHTNRTKGEKVKHQYIWPKD